jgi:hypothetical protein
MATVTTTVMRTATDTLMALARISTGPEIMPDRPVR